MWNDYKVLKELGTTSLQDQNFVTTTFGPLTYVPFYTTNRVESTNLQFSWEFGAWISSFHPNLKLLRVSSIDLRSFNTLNKSKKVFRNFFCLFVLLLFFSPLPFSQREIIMSSFRDLIQHGDALMFQEMGWL
jgi:hypothetical protein